MQSFTSKNLLKEMGALASVADTPTFELAETGKHDISVMMACCAAEEETYWAQPAGDRLCAAPYYFRRAAVLHRKAKDYAAEIAVCKRWAKIIADYKKQPEVKAGRWAQVQKGPSSIDIIERMAKAKAALAKKPPSARPKRG